MIEALLVLVYLNLFEQEDLLLPADSIPMSS